MAKLTSALLLFCWACTTGCNKPDKYATDFTEADFGKSRSLSARTLNITNCFKPSRIKVVPSRNLILILEDGSTGILAHAYTADSLKYIRAFIRNDGQSLLIATDIQVDESISVVHVFDPMQELIFSYSIDSIISAKTPIVPIRIIGDRNKKKKNSILEDRVWNPVVLPGSGRIFGLHNNKPGEPLRLLSAYDSTLRYLKAKEFYPDTSRKLPFYAYNDIYQGALNLSADGKIMIYNAYNIDLIQLFNDQGELIAGKYGPKGHRFDVVLQKTKLGVAVLPKENSFYCYTSPARMNGNSIYVLYNGKSKKTRNEHSETLFQFDHTLAPVARYLLERQVVTFDIDWVNNILYGISKTPDTKLVLYNLN